MKIQTQFTYAALTLLTAVGITFIAFFPEWTSAAPPSNPQPSATPTNAVPPQAQTNSTPRKIASPPPKKPQMKRPLTGAELYSVNCNRCHPERYPTERTAA
jgi:hypothetical protein